MHSGSFYHIQRPETIESGVCSSSGQLSSELTRFTATVLYMYRLTGDRSYQVRRNASGTVKSLLSCSDCHRTKGGRCSRRGFGEPSYRTGSHTSSTSTRRCPNTMTRESSPLFIPKRKTCIKAPPGRLLTATLLAGSSTTTSCSRLPTSSRSTTGSLLPKRIHSESPRNLPPRTKHPSGPETLLSSRRRRSAREPRCSGGHGCCRRRPREVGGRRVPGRKEQLKGPWPPYSRLAWDEAGLAICQAY